MILSDLVAGFPVDLAGAGHTEVGHLRYDSRLVEPGDVFVAVRGFHVDGHSYLNQAARAGAIALLGEAAAPIVPVPYLRVDDSRAVLAQLAARLAGYPARRLGVIGVTGTDGKSTTCHLIDAVLRAAGLATGRITTIDFQLGGREWDNSSRQTTPESPEIQTFLGELAAQRGDWAVIETSSHALELHRVDGCQYDVGVFTNLSPEHLDFHHSELGYLRAKARLFEMVNDSVAKGRPKAAILNADELATFFLASISKRPVITYGLGRRADIQAVDVVTEGLRNSFTVVADGEAVAVRPQLVGSFNISNCLAAFGVARALGIDLATARRGIEGVSGVPGRMEVVDEGQDFGLVVDYAHTPESLRKVLNVLRPLTRRRLIVVFGSAGERDTAKRPRLGATAAELADYAVITDEDPRGEPSDRILDEIAAGMTAVGWREPKHFVRLADRRLAVHHAVELAQPGDVVLLAGKGHESCILVGDCKLPWNERQVARDAIAARGRP